MSFPLQILNLSLSGDCSLSGTGQIDLLFTGGTGPWVVETAPPPPSGGTLPYSGYNPGDDLQYIASNLSAGPYYIRISHAGDPLNIREEVDAVVHDHDIHAGCAACAFTRVVDAQRRADNIGIIISQAGDKGICIAHFDHHRAQDIYVSHAFPRDRERGQARGPGRSALEDGQGPARLCAEPRRHPLLSHAGRKRRRR